jgi:hypothetical protein
MFKAAKNWAALVAPILFVGCGTLSPSRDDVAKPGDGRAAPLNTMLNDSEIGGQPKEQGHTSGSGPHFSYERLNGKIGP